MSLRLIINIAILLALCFLAAVISWLWHEKKTLEGFKEAYMYETKQKHKIPSWFQTNTGASIQVNHAAMKQLLKSDSIKTAEIKKLGIRLNQVSSFTEASQKILLKSNLKGTQINIGDSPGIMAIDSTQFHVIKLLFNKLNDSVKTEVSLSANLKIIEHHSRKKFLGIGLGKKKYTTTVTSDNPDIKFGNIETIKEK